MNSIKEKLIVRGSTAKVFEALTVPSLDEPNSQYGLIAESVEVPGDRSWVAFTLNAEARFHDGSPITVADVIWSFDTLKARGRPFFRSYYRSVVKAEAVGARTVAVGHTANDQVETDLQRAIEKIRAVVRLRRSDERLKA
jgi:microcin C transport system substrate-binding protein